jgi:hypothetical protein
MNYIFDPFNFTGSSATQIRDDLQKANNNFNILGSAFINDDPKNQPIKRATYIGTNEPSDAVVGTLWLDTSVSPPVFKIYDGTNWISLSGNTLRRINGNDLIEDYPLAIGEEAIYYWDTVENTSLPLHIAVNGTLYEMFMQAPYNTTADITVTGLLPNNTMYANSFVMTRIGLYDNGSSGAYVGTNSYIWCPYLSTGLSSTLISTFPDRKFTFTILRATVISSYGNGCLFLVGNRWTSTTTPWTSLGTLITNPTNGVIIVLVRRLA